MRVAPPTERLPAHGQALPTHPLLFPVEQEVPETDRHLTMRTALWLSVRSHLGDRASVGSEQFVYWDECDPSRCCAPDLFVHVGPRQKRVTSWKTWQRGTPELAVEIVSDADAPARPWDEKITRYARLGVAELVRFDPDDAERPLRIWDRMDGDLVERDAADPAFSRCTTLGAYWQIVEDAENGPTLRVSSDAEGNDLWPTPEERVRELEAELAKHQRG
jgi:Putative restriction endonuclease